MVSPTSRVGSFLGFVVSFLGARALGSLQSNLTCGFASTNPPCWPMFSFAQIRLARRIDVKGGFRFGQGRLARAAKNLLGAPVLSQSGRPAEVNKLLDAAEELGDLFNPTSSDPRRRAAPEGSESEAGPESNTPTSEDEESTESLSNSAAGEQLLGESGAELPAEPDPTPSDLTEGDSGPAEGESPPALEESSHEAQAVEPPAVAADSPAATDEPESGSPWPDLTETMSQQPESEEPPTIADLDDPNDARVAPSIAADLPAAIDEQESGSPWPDLTETMSQQPELKGPSFVAEVSGESEAAETPAAVADLEPETPVPDDLQGSSELSGPTLEDPEPRAVAYAEAKEDIAEESETLVPPAATEDLAPESPESDDGQPSSSLSGLTLEDPDQTLQLETPAISDMEGNQDLADESDVLVPPAATADLEPESAIRGDLEPSSALSGLTLEEPAPAATDRPAIADSESAEDIADMSEASLPPAAASARTPVSSMFEEDAAYRQPVEERVPDRTSVAARMAAAQPPGRDPSSVRVRAQERSVVSPRSLGERIPLPPPAPIIGWDPNYIAQLERKRNTDRAIMGLFALAAMILLTFSSGLF